MALDIFESLSRLSCSSSLAILISATVALLVILFFHWLKNDTIPIINKYKGDIFSKKAHAEYLTNSEKLISDGVARYNGPFRVITTLGSRVILPAKLANWVKNCKELDHVQLVADEYFAGYPGFDGNGAVVNPDRMLIEVTKAKLNQSSRKKPGFENGHMRTCCSLLPS